MKQQKQAYCTNPQSQTANALSDSDEICSHPMVSQEDPAMLIKRVRSCGTQPAVRPAAAAAEGVKSQPDQELSSEGKRKLQTSRSHQVVSVFQGKFHSGFHRLSVTLHCFPIVKECSLVISGVWSHHATWSLQKPNLHSQPFPENSATRKASLELNERTYPALRGRTRIGTHLTFRAHM